MSAKLAFINYNCYYQYPSTLTIYELKVHHNPLIKLFN